MNKYSNINKNNNNNNVVAYSPVGSTGGNLKARLLGSACAGVSELFFFHPVDTCAKRLMSNTTTKIFVSGNMNATLANANQVIFKEAATAPPLQKIKSMFPGLGFAAGYKILQRCLKFGGQPFVKEYINKNYGDNFKSVFGAKVGRVMASGTAGACMGLMEIALLPLDVLKIKAQTNPETLKGRGVVDLFMSEGRGLYRGAGWTAARNAPGSFALFGGAAVVHHGVFGLENISEATFVQNTVASVAGSVASITIAAPLDVIKTRIQNRPFNSPESGVSILTKLVRNEGFGAFFKGLGPKLLVVGPKLIFSYTIALNMISYFEKTFA